MCEVPKEKHKVLFVPDDFFSTLTYCTSARNFGLKCIDKKLG